jgi:hypothetical protein
MRSVGQSRAEASTAMLTRTVLMEFRTLTGMERSALPGG